MSGTSVPVAQLLVPAIRWDTARGYDLQRPLIDRALAAGVGGFILFGGETEAVRALTKDLQRRTRTPLLIAADMERGAGQQFAGATGLPPLAAIASLGDPEAVRRAARLTAREARTLGVNWDLAPVCDLDLLPDNPVVGTRSLGADAERVADLAGEWIDACQSEGVLACAKHFPGHGRTTADSHLELPVVTTDADTLLAKDLAPFRAAIDAGVGSMMTAHVAYPALDPSGAPATLSREMLQWLLRQRLRYEGLVVADSLNMQGLLRAVPPPGGEGAAAVRAIQAGCDMLLAPSDVDATVAALGDAIRTRMLDPDRVQQALRRRLKWAQWVSPPNDYRRPSMTDTALGAQLADRVVRAERGTVPTLRVPVDVLAVDDDAEPGADPAAAAARRRQFVEALRIAGVDARATETADGASGSTLVVALFGECAPSTGRPGYADRTCAAVADACAAAARSARDAVVVLFGHPRRAADIPEAPAVLCAWTGDRVMQDAAARWLARKK